MRVKASSPAKALAHRRAVKPLTAASSSRPTRSSAPRVVPVLAASFEVEDGSARQQGSFPSQLRIPTGTPQRSLTIAMPYQSLVARVHGFLGCICGCAARIGLGSCRPSTARDACTGCHIAPSVACGPGVPVSAIEVTSESGQPNKIADLQSRTLDRAAHCAAPLYCMCMLAVNRPHARCCGWLCELLFACTPAIPSVERWLHRTISYIWRHSCSRVSAVLRSVRW